MGGLWPKGRMSLSSTTDEIQIRPFSWDDVALLVDVMHRAGSHPFEYAENPLETFKLSLETPRLEPTRDILVADSGSRLEGWVRVDIEPGTSRAIVGLGVDPDLDAVAIRPRLLRMARDLAIECGMNTLHVPVDGADNAVRMTVGSIGMHAVRVYHDMEYHPAPAYLGGNHRPVPDEYSVRTMVDSDEDNERLMNIQNAAFMGSWGYEVNTIPDIEASLRLPGQGSEWVKMVDSAAGETAGYIWTKFEPSDGMSIGYVGMVGVHPEHRRRGLGSVITAAGVKLLRDAGAGAIKLEVDRENKAARRVYRDLGFSRNGKTTWYELELSAD
jgi:mycothiol synthase